MKSPTSTATLLSAKTTLHLNKSKGFWHIANAMLFILFLALKQFASAQSGNALQCSGGYATVTGIDISNASFTIEFWMKHTDDGNFNTAIGQGSTADNHGLHIGLKGGNQFYFNYYNNDFTYATTTDGNWHHWACVNDGTTTIRKIYKDGVLVATSDASSNFLGTGTFYIGRTSFGGGINGTLDEVRIWSIARTPTEIQADMNREVSSGTGLLAAYHCNQGTANGNNIGITTLTDATGNYTGSLNDFTLTGTTNNFVNALISGSPAALNFTGGRVHAFNGTTDNTYILGSQSATVEFWAKAAPNFSFPLDFSYDYQCVSWSTTIGWVVNGGDQYGTGFAIEDCWHHYAFTYDGATGRCTGL